MKQLYSVRTYALCPSYLKLTIIMVAYMLLPTFIQAQSLVTQTESFEGTIFPAPGWNQYKGNVNPVIGGNGTFSRLSWASTINPVATANPSGTANIMMYNSFSALVDDTTLLISKPYDFSNNGGVNPQMSFYMYRDANWPAKTDRIEVFINSSPTIVGATPINHAAGYNYINRSNTLNPVAAANTWQQYVFPLNAAMYAVGKKWYFIIRAISNAGDNIYMDHFQVNTYPSMTAGSDASFDLVYQNTASVGKPSTNNWVVGIKCVISGTSGCGNVSLGSALKLDSLLLNTNGCTTVSDIQNAQIWYTGGYNQFSTGYISPFPAGGQAVTNFGQIIAAPATNLDFVNQSAPCFYLEYDTTYFWLSYDIKATAAGADLVDADFRGANVGAANCPVALAGDGYNLNPLTTSSIPGASQIDLPYCIPLSYTGTSWLGYHTNDFVDNALLFGEPPSVIRIGTTIGGPPNPNNGLPTNLACYPNCNFRAHPPDYTLWAPALGTTAVLKQGSTYTINVGAGTYCCLDNIAVFIDYDRDGTFTQAPAVQNEKLGQVNLSASSIAGITFTVPATNWPGPQPNCRTGNTRLRIREWFAASNINACGTSGYGEVEDFTITIIPNCSPLYKLWLGNTNDWNNPANWCGGVPTINDDVVIDKSLALPAGTYYMPTILTSESANCKNIRIATTDTLYINAPNPAALPLKIKGDLQIDGGFIVVTSYFNSIPFSLGTLSNSLITPFRSNAADARMQFIYTAAEMSTKGMIAGDTITGIQFTVAGKGSTSFYKNFQVRFANNAGIPSQFASACALATTGLALTAQQTVVSVTGTVGLFTATVASTSKLFVGQMVSSTSLGYFPVGTTITAINGPTTITLSATPSITGTDILNFDYSTLLGLNTLPLTGGGTTNYITWDGVNNLLIDFSYDNSAGIGATNDLINITQTTGSKQTLLLTDNTNAQSGMNLSCGIPATVSNNFWTALSIDRPNMTFLISRPYSKAKIDAQGQWTNNGLFTAGNSEVKLDSNVVQNIQGTQSTTFKELNISKTTLADNVLLQKNTTVSSLLTLTSGQLRLNKNTLSVNDSALTAVTRVAGMLISEDSLSKLNWASFSTTGSKIIPWGSGAVAAPLYIPDTFNITTAGVAGGPNMGNLTLYTYLAPANLPAPPTVTQMNSINYPLTCGITLGGTNVTTASTATLCLGVIVSGIGIPAAPIPTRVVSITNATTFVISAAATATNAAAALTLGGCNSNDIPSAVDRFWGIAKDGTVNGTSATPAVTDISLSYESGLRPAAFSSTSGVATPAGSVQAKGFPWRSSPTYYCSTNSSTTLSNFGSTANLFAGMSILGPGIPIGATITSIVSTTQITISLAATTTTNVEAVTFPAIPTNAAWVRTFGIAGQPAPIPTTNGGTGALTHTYYPGATASADAVKIAAYNWPVSIGNNNPWTIAGNTTATALPIELLRFNAVPEGSKVHLTWTTSSEKDNDYFTVERTTNTTEYDFIAKVNSYFHNSTSPLNYDAYDNAPKMGLNYYRLKQTDFDGQFTYSNIVPVNFGNNKRFEITSVNASPLNNSVDVMFYYDSSLPLTYTLTDVTGRIIVANEKMDNTTEGINLLHINKTLSSGMYNIILRNENGVQSRKFIY